MKIQLFAAAVLLALLRSQASAQVASERIANAEREPSNWLTYSGNYQSHRFSPLTQIARANVGQLKPAWVYQMRRTGIVETSPIVADGVIYITEPPSTAAPSTRGSAAPRATSLPARVEASGRS